MLATFVVPPRTPPDLVPGAPRKTKDAVRPFTWCEISAGPGSNDERSKSSKRQIFLADDLHAKWAHWRYLTIRHKSLLCKGHQKVGATK